MLAKYRVEKARILSRNVPEGVRLFRSASTAPSALIARDRATALQVLAVGSYWVFFRAHAGGQVHVFVGWADIAPHLHHRYVIPDTYGKVSNPGIKLDLYIEVRF